MNTLNILNAKRTFINPDKKKYAPAISIASDINIINTTPADLKNFFTSILSPCQLAFKNSIYRLGIGYQHINIYIIPYYVKHFKF